MKLNSDIINYIYSFLPIVDNKVKELNKSILNLHVNIYLLVINNFTSDEFRYKYLCYMLQLGGPIFVKIGQNIANKKNIDPILKKNLIKLQENNYYG